MTNASNIFSAFFPVGDSAAGVNPGAPASLDGIAFDQSAFASLLSGEQIDIAAPPVEIMPAITLAELQPVEAPLGANPTPMPTELPALPAVQPELTSGQSIGSQTQLSVVVPAPPESVPPTPQNSNVPPPPVETVVASMVKIPAAPEVPKVQPLPGPIALPENGKARPAPQTAPVPPAARIVPVQTEQAVPANKIAEVATQNSPLPAVTEALSQDAPNTPGAILQNAQVQAAQIQPTVSSGPREAAASNGILTEPHRQGPANTLLQTMARDDAVEFATVKTASRTAHAITANPLPSAVNVVSAVVSNVAASVPAGGTGAAAADTVGLMTSQSAVQAQLGENAFAGGGGTQNGGEFSPGARALIGQAQALQSAASQSADFNQVLQQAAPAPGAVEPAVKTASAAPAASTGGSAQPAATPGEQVAVQIGLAARFGARQISLQLRPASLGEVNIDLNIANDGQVRATVLAERQETLDLLQRDARGLERALQDAGLKSDAGSLQFGLRGEGREQRPQHGQGDAYRAQAQSPDGDGGDDQPPAWAADAYNSLTDRTLDIRV